MFVVGSIENLAKKNEPSWRCFSTLSGWAGVNRIQLSGRFSLLQLFFVNFVIFLTGMGLLPLLPLYAKQFGASATDVGFYMAITYAAITAGTMLTDRLSRWMAHRKLFISAGVLGVPALFLLGQAAEFWQVIILTAVVWFTGGIGIALVNVFTGQYATSNSRGKAFSLTFLALPLASLVAGLTVGRLAEWQGYSFMFAILALAWAGWPIVVVVAFTELLAERHLQHIGHRRPGDDTGNLCHRDHV